jgi:hypothetical protein
MPITPIQFSVFNFQFFKTIQRTKAGSATQCSDRIDPGTALRSVSGLCARPLNFGVPHTAVLSVDVQVCKNAVIPAPDQVEGRNDEVARG